MSILSIQRKGLEILIAVVFCKECVLPVQWWFLFCKGGEDGRGTDGGGGRAKSRIARPKLIIKSCVKMYMNSNIHKEFPAPLPHLNLSCLFLANWVLKGISCFNLSNLPFWWNSAIRFYRRTTETEIFVFSDFTFFCAELPPLNFSCLFLTNWTLRGVLWCNLQNWNEEIWIYY